MMQCDTATWVNGVNGSFLGHEKTRVIYGHIPGVARLVSLKGTVFPSVMRELGGYLCLFATANSVQNVGMKFEPLSRSKAGRRQGE